MTGYFEFSSLTRLQAVVREFALPSLPALSSAGFGLLRNPAARGACLFAGRSLVVRGSYRWMLVGVFLACRLVTSSPFVFLSALVVKKEPRREPLPQPAALQRRWRAGKFSGHKYPGKIACSSPVSLLPHELNLERRHD